MNLLSCKEDRFSPDGRYFAYGRSDGTVVLARNPFWPGVNDDGCIDLDMFRTMVNVEGDAGGAVIVRNLMR